MAYQIQTLLDSDMKLANKKSELPEQKAFQVKYISL